MSAVTPGLYLKSRRLTAGMTTHDVALGIDTVPPVAAFVRESMIVGIEADLVPVRMETMIALAAIPMLSIDLPHLARLVDCQADPIAIRIISTGPLKATPA